MTNSKFGSLTKIVSKLAPLLLLVLFSVLALGDYLGLSKLRILSLIIFIILFLSTLIMAYKQTKLIFTDPNAKFWNVSIQVTLITSLLIRSFSAAITRSTNSGRDMVWDLDNLFFVSNARSISRYGNTDSNLGILSEPLNYHTAPSFLLAVFQSSINLDPLDAIYFFDGYFVILLIFFGLRFVQITNHNTLRNRIAFLVSLNLPFTRIGEDFRIYPKYLVLRPSFTFDIMFGTLIGFLILASLCLVLVTFSGLSNRIATMLTVFALSEVKPQFIPATFAVIALFHIIKGTNIRSISINLTKDSFLILSVFLLTTTFFTSNQIGIIYRISLEEFSIKFVTKFLTSTIVVTSFFVILIILYTSYKNPNAMTLWKRQSILILSAILSIYLVGNVILSLIQLDFAFDTFITPEFASSYSRNDLQVLTPFLFFGTCCLIVMIIEILKNPIFPLSVLSLFSLGLSIVFLCLHLTGSDITEDFSDLRESKQAIASIPPNKVILTDTFHYPSRPSPRPYFGYLSSLSNEQFYFSMPANYQSSSSWKEKYTNSLLFFGSRISESHMSFLEKSGVSVILHSKLCKSPLIDSLKSYIKPTYENANFLILQIEPDQHQGLRMKLPLVSTFIDPDSYLQNNLCKPPPDWKMPLSSGQFVFQNR